jgi:hypothetical protein
MANPPNIQKSIWTHKKFGIITWFLVIGSVTYSAFNSHHYNFKENLFRAACLCFLFLAMALFNTSQAQPFTTIGTLAALPKGLAIGMVCLFIFILCANWDDARLIISVFEDLPSQERLAA